MKSILLIVIVLLPAVIILGLALNAWKALKLTDRMLEDIDKSKLKNLDEDGWDDDEKDD